MLVGLLVFPSSKRRQSYSYSWNTVVSNRANRIDTDSAMALLFFFLAVFWGREEKIELQQYKLRMGDAFTTFV